MGDRRCCCECPEWSDNFNRANSTDLGADWTEESGDSDIYSNTLRMPASAMVVCARVPPRSFKATISYTLIQDGDKLWLIPDWQDGAVSYHYMEVEASGAWIYTRLRKCVSGSHSTIVAVDANGHQTLCESSIGFNGDVATLNVCLSSPDGVKWMISYQGAYAGVDRYVVETPYGTVFSRRVAIKNAGSNTMQFDDFDLIGHRAIPNAECPDCTCTCRGYGLPQQLLMGTFENIEGAPRLDGWELPLRLRTADRIWVPDEWPGDSPPVDERLYCLHENYNLIDEIWVLQGTDNWYVDDEFVCIGPTGAGGYDNPQFGIDWQCDGCQALGPYAATLISAQCDPVVIVLEFDFYTDPEICNVAGEVMDCEWCFAVADEPAGSPIRRHFRVTVTE